MKNSRTSNRLCEVLFLAGLVIVLSLGGCNSPSEETPDEPEMSFRVVAASYPLQYLTERIAGEKIHVEFPVDADTDPREWSPSVDQIKEIQKADLVVVNGPGAAYAKWLVRVSLLESSICNTTSEFDTDNYFKIKDYLIVHTHGPEGEHSHAYMVPYPWLDPEVAKAQAETITRALERTYPDMSAEFQANLGSLQKDLDQLAKEFQEAKASGLVVTSNPDAKFLTRALGYQDQHLLLFDFEESSLEDAKSRIEKLSGQEIEKFVWIVGAGQAVDDAQRAAIEALFSDAIPEIVQIDLLDHAPENGDYLSAMRDLVNKLK